MKPPEKIRVRTTSVKAAIEVYNHIRRCENCGRIGSYIVKDEAQCIIGLCLACMFEQPDFVEITLLDSQHVTIIEQIREWANQLDNSNVPFDSIIAGMREVANDMETGDS